MTEIQETKSRPRKRLRLTLGGMMLVVLIVGGWLGWIVHRAKVQREAVAAIVKAGGDVVYDYQWGVYEAQPREPKWLRELIGRDYFDTVYGINANKPAVDDAVVAQIGRVPQVRWLGLQGSTVTDAGLARLAGLKELRTIHLRSPNVNGSGFRHFLGLRKLYSLQLNQTPVTDENLAHLIPLSSIRKLGFAQVPITDLGMKTLAEMKGLEEVWFYKCDVGDAGLREIGRIKRPMLVHVRAGTRITPEGIEAMKALAPQMNITP